MEFLHQRGYGKCGNGACQQGNRYKDLSAQIYSAVLETYGERFQDACVFCGYRGDACCIPGEGNGKRAGDGADPGSALSDHFWHWKHIDALRRVRE